MRESDVEPNSESRYDRARESPMSASGLIAKQLIISPGLPSNQWVSSFSFALESIPGKFVARSKRYIVFLNSIVVPEANFFGGLASLARCVLKAVILAEDSFWVWAM